MILLLACSSPTPDPGPAPSHAAPWPAPIQPVSAASVAWLKSQGWWPLSVGYFADVPGYAALYPVMREERLLEARGLEVTYTSFLSGPPILEAFVAGQTQVTAYGDFPFWNTVDKGVPAVAWGLTGTNVEAALLVPPDSPVQGPEGLRGDGPPRVIGTTLGSYCEFYLLAMGAVRGLEAGRDYRLAGMSMREAQLVPKGVDAVAVFDPHASFAVEKGLGRKVDDAWPYYFATGYEMVRREIHEHAPDVVQAVADAEMQALLTVRADPERAVDLYLADPKAKAWSREAIRTQIDRYILLYKPTYKYIHAEFWATEDARVVEAQVKAGRLTRARDAGDLATSFVPTYLERSFATLGWAVPPRPVFLPADWSGTVGSPPYPRYVHAGDPAQPWPEAGDLR